jgi:hypothetical protein
MAESNIIEHRDRLGRLIKIGDFVAAADNNRLSVGIVNKLNPKMVQYKTVNKEKYWHGRRVNKYPDDVVVIEGPDVSIYLLKNST